MQLTCPCCGEQFPLEAGMADDEGKRLAALFAGMEPKLGKAVLQYLRLFSPAKRSLRTSKAIRLVEDLLALVTPGTVTRDARTTDTRRATPTLWAMGIEQMLSAREKLTLPLDNHHYLRAVVYGLAGDAQATAAAAEADRSRRSSNGPGRPADYFEKLARINGDEALKLITPEQAEKMRSELQ
ncbi:MAG TPA: hypothetical protein DHW73_04290 [Pseudomonas sp.]|nr:hypothetical protein [Pseudomonadales bacterium]OWL84629.1 hypothetical protein B7O88_16300 [Halopseudomonas aestusnigri]HCL40577.1 hypothetical protein [Pseudomonas sp.]